MKKWFKRLKNEKGMTLVELLAVVVILGIVAAIAVPSISNIIQNSKDDAHTANGLLIINAAKLAVTTGDIPLNSSGNADINIDDLVTKSFLDAVPKSPYGDNAYSSGTVTVRKGKYSITLIDGTNTYHATEQQLNGSGFPKPTTTPAAGS